MFTKMQQKNASTKQKMQMLKITKTHTKKTNENPFLSSNFLLGMLLIFFTGVLVPWLGGRVPLLVLCIFVL